MTARQRRAVLAIGSNLGDRLGHLQGAVDLLSEAVRVLAVSPVVETDPVGGPAQDDYLNAVVVVETSLTPRALLDLAHRVETAHGRVRAERWGPRALDVDVVAVGDDRVDEPDLVIPHRRAAERAFVLVPWARLEPEASIPGFGRVGALLKRLDTAGVRPRSDLVLQVPVAEVP